MNCVNQSTIDIIIKLFSNCSLMIELSQYMNFEDNNSRCQAMYPKISAYIRKDSKYRIVPLFTAENNITLTTLVYTNTQETVEALSKFYNSCEKNMQFPKVIFIVQQHSCGYPISVMGKFSEAGKDLFYVEDGNEVPSSYLTTLDDCSRFGDVHADTVLKQSSRIIFSCNKAAMIEWYVEGNETYINDIVFWNDIAELYLNDCIYTGEETKYGAWTRGNVAEAFPLVMSPLSWSLWGNTMNDLLRGSYRFYSFYKHAKRKSFITLMDGKLMYNIGVVNHYIRKIGSVALDEVVGGETAGTGRSKSIEKINPFKLLLNAPRIKKGEKKNEELRRISREKWKEFTDNFKIWIHEDYTTYSQTALIDKIIERITYGRNNMYLHTDATSAAFTKTAILRWKLSKYNYNSQAEVLKVLENVDGIEIAQIDSVLSEVAQDILNRGRNDEIINILIQGFSKKDLYECGFGEVYELIFTKIIMRFGNRGGNELEIMQKTWLEDPSFLIDLLISKLCNKERRLDNTLIDEINDSFFSDDNFKVLIDQVREYTRLRENNKHFLYFIIADIKRMFRALECKIGFSHILDNTKDIYFLSFTELLNLAKEKNGDMYQRIINIRKMIYRLYCEYDRKTRESTKDILRPGTLHGMIACTGIIYGHVRIIEFQSDMKELATNEILVAHTLDISWSPLFSRVSGVVTEIGGLLSHAAIVSREYNIPTLVNVENATKILKNGDYIRLDAVKGTIDIVEIVHNETISVI